MTGKQKESSANKQSWVKIPNKYRGKFTSKGYLDYSSIKEFIVKLENEYEEKENQ